MKTIEWIQIETRDGVTWSFCTKVNKFAVIHSSGVRSELKTGHELVKNVTRGNDPWIIVWPTTGVTMEIPQNEWEDAPTPDRISGEVYIRTDIIQSIYYATATD